MKFKTLSIIKHPVDTCWKQYRDGFEQIGEAVDDLKYIRLLDREERGPGRIYTEYEWQAIPPLPARLRDKIHTDMLTWIDHADWNEPRHHCRWSIVTRYFGNRLDCAGQTTFEEALGGRGCRLTFEGEMIWGDLPSSEAVLVRMVEPFLKQMILQNFRKVSKVVEQVLDKA
jgi:hypothetical protein